jgi:hypothetical protein
MKKLYNRCIQLGFKISFSDDIYGSIDIIMNNLKRLNCDGLENENIH